MSDRKNSSVVPVRLLDNYRNLVSRVDDLCLRVTGQFDSQLACRAGCDGCCRHLSLFWVEAISLAYALENLPDEQSAKVRARTGSNETGDPCPLLVNGLCALYAARPVICRTHGLPLLTLQDGKQVIDFCPLNFQGLDALPGSAVIDLERLNTTLAAINTLFCKEFFKNHPPPNERVSIAEVLTILF